MIVARFRSMTAEKSEAYYPPIPPHFPQCKQKIENISEIGVFFSTKWKHIYERFTIYRTYSTDQMRRTDVVEMENKQKLVLIANLNHNQSVQPLEEYREPQAGFAWLLCGGTK